MRKAEVFISHITDEAPVAEALKLFIKSSFGDRVEVFVASDYDSIGTGDDWFRAIVDSISRATVTIVLLSHESTRRSWINFETGYSYGRADAAGHRRIVPLRFRGLEAGDVGFPLAHFHIRKLIDKTALTGMLATISEAAGVALGDVRPDLDAFVAELSQIESELPVRSLLFEPHITPGDNQLRFRLSNTGNLDVELIELEVCVPAQIISSGIRYPRIPNVCSFELQTFDGIVYQVGRERPLDGPIGSGFGIPYGIPNILSPFWTPRDSAMLTFALAVPSKEAAADLTIRYKAVARGVRMLPQEMLVADIPYAR